MNDTYSEQLFSHEAWIAMLKEAKRLDKKFTIQAIGNYIGRSRQGMYEWMQEKNAKSITMDAILKVCEFTGQDPKKYFPGIEKRIDLVTDTAEHTEIQNDRLKFILVLAKGIDDKDLRESILDEFESINSELVQKENEVKKYRKQLTKVVEKLNEIERKL